MEPREAKNTRQTIELTILAPVIAAIQKVAPQIEGATLDLGKRAVVIGSPTPIIGPEWNRVRDVGKETIRSIISRDSAIQIAQPRPSTYGYTFHSPSDAIRNHLGQFSQITEFAVDLAAIESLAEAYAELGKRSEAFDLVVAFALRGSASDELHHGLCVQIFEQKRRPLHVGERDALEVSRLPWDPMGDASGVTSAVAHRLDGFPQRS
jgi:hypothetical protein